MKKLLWNDAANSLIQLIISVTIENTLELNSSGVIAIAQYKDNCKVIHTTFEFRKRLCK